MLCRRHCKRSATGRHFFEQPLQIHDWLGNARPLAVAISTEWDLRQLREIKSHNSLRGIAALLVVFHHYRSNLPSDLSPDNYTQLFASAGSFVDFFFMLSGFVIAYVYTNRTPDWLLTSEAALQESILYISSL